MNEGCVLEEQQHGGCVFVLLGLSDLSIVGLTIVTHLSFQPSTFLITNRWLITALISFRFRLLINLKEGRNGMGHLHSFKGTRSLAEEYSYEWGCGLNHLLFIMSMYIVGLDNLMIRMNRIANSHMPTCRSINFCCIFVYACTCMCVGEGIIKPLSDCVFKI